ncbi:F510_1955 family glycosylhydrolase [Kribbia dieselivorans]|uniref:F510_1955 family glycosylhydrolase n=1 Tax=Kribbia dieselivorans TaxID=331526 RepID=UPI000838C7D7|nr:hypothetical protein [Kribbia dieselivorans]
MSTRSGRRTLGLAVAGLALGALVACRAPSTTPAVDVTPSPASSASGQQGTIPTSTAPVAITHVHGIARDPETDELLLATHEGLYRQVDGGLVQAGPVIDLMGFAVAPDGTYYASGHPGLGVDLPQPVGLLSSADGGHTWRQESRGGQSDFHALTAGPTQVTAFDGALRTTTDGKLWVDRSIPSPPRTLAASPRTGRLVATTADGLLASTNNGASWTALATPELPLLATWADDRTIATITTTGRLAVSSDRGESWDVAPKRIGVAEALWADRTSKGRLEVIVFVDGKVLSTSDSGATTTTLVE